METITFNQLITTAAVILILLGAYKSIMEVVKIRREERRINNAPVEEIRETVTKQAEMLDRDKRRLDKLEDLQDNQNDELTELRTGLNVMMRSSLAMTRHMLHGNNVEGLNESERDITDYLTGRSDQR